MTDFIWALCTSGGIIVFIAIVCIAYHYWQHQHTPGICPFCECKLNDLDRCDKCGGTRIHLGGAV